MLANSAAREGQATIFRFHARRMQIDQEILRREGWSMKNRQACQATDPEDLISFQACVPWIIMDERGGLDLSRSQ